MSIMLKADSFLLLLRYSTKNSVFELPVNLAFHEALIVWTYPRKRHNKILTRPLLWGKPSSINLTQAGKDLPEYLFVKYRFNTSEELKIKRIKFLRKIAPPQNIIQPHNLSST